MTVEGRLRSMAAVDRGTRVCGWRGVRASRLGVAAVVTGTLVLAGPATVALGTATVAGAQAVPGYSGAGSQVWVTRYDGPGHGGDEGRAIVVSPDGSTVFVTGPSQGVTTGVDYATEALDAQTGAQLWLVRYNGTGDGDDVPVAIGVSPDGGTVYVTGSSEGTSTGLDYATVAYDAGTGARVWTRRYVGPGAGADVPTGLAVAPDGSRVVVTGSSENGADGLDYLTESLNPATGAVQWVHRYDGSAHGDDTATAVAVSPDSGQVFVTGSRAIVGGGSDIYTQAYAAGTGVTQWAKQYNGATGTSASGETITVSPDSSLVYVAGWYHSGSVNVNLQANAYATSDGTSAWQTHLEKGAGPDQTIQDISEAISSDGAELYIGWTAIDPPDEQIDQQLQFLLGNGERIVAPVARGEVRAVAALPDNWGAVSVGGIDVEAPEQQNYDHYETEAYGPSSLNTSWANQYAGSTQGDNEAYAVAVSPDSSTVYVTGQSQGASTGLDFATEAIAN
jgi:WD40 repeat protein